MANNNIFALGSLVRVYNGMIAVFPNSAKEKALYVSDLASKFNDCYAMNNSTVCFVSGNEVFVIPYTRSTMSSLDYAGFHRDYFYVPFSNGDYPKANQTKWNNLWEKAHQSYKADFIEDCENYCNKRHIGAISKSTLANCFEMPENGVRVKHLYFEDVYYPVINQNGFDSRCVEIGHFCYNNGRVVFVYRNGKTYVAKGYKILDELRAAGYSESGLFVPFSNGEQICDPYLRSRWESINR